MSCCDTYREQRKKKGRLWWLLEPCSRTFIISYSLAQPSWLWRLSSSPRSLGSLVSEAEVSGSLPWSQQVACRIPMADALCEQWANCLLYVPCHVPGLYWARVRATIDVCPPTLVGYTFLWKNVFFLNFFLKNKDLTTFSDCKVSHWFQKITPCLSSHGLRIMCEAKSETVAHIGGHWRCSLIRLLMPDHTGSRGEESAASESRIQCAEPGTLMVGFSSLFSSKLFCSSIPLLTLLTSLISDSQYCAEKGCEM